MEQNVRDVHVSLVEELIDANREMENEAEAIRRANEFMEQQLHGGEEGGDDTMGEGQHAEDVILQEVLVESFRKQAAASTSRPSTSKEVSGDSLVDAIIKGKKPANFTTEDAGEIGRAVRDNAASDKQLGALDTFDSMWEADTAVRAMGAHSAPFVRAPGGSNHKRLYLCGHPTKSAFKGMRKKGAAGGGGDGGGGGDDGGDDGGDGGNDDHEDEDKLVSKRGGKRSGGELQERLLNPARGKCSAFVQLQEIRGEALLTGKWRKTALNKISDVNTTLSKLPDGMPPPPPHITTTHENHPPPTAIHHHTPPHTNYYHHPPSPPHITTTHQHHHMSPLPIETTHHPLLFIITHHHTLTTTVPPSIIITTTTHCLHYHCIHCRLHNAFQSCCRHCDTTSPMRGYRYFQCRRS